MLRKACIIDGITFWHMPTGGVTLGYKDDSTPLSIDDKERASGLYILGKPRMGKSWLMVNMILQDIENGHGVFFLDPNGDAIDDLISRTTVGVLVFDPEDDRYSFGINLLECANIDNAAARN